MAARPSVRGRWLVVGVCRNAASRCSFVSIRPDDVSGTSLTAAGSRTLASSSRFQTNQNLIQNRQRILDQQYQADDQYVNEGAAEYNDDAAGYDDDAVNEAMAERDEYAEENGDDGYADFSNIDFAKVSVMPVSCVN